VLCRWRAAARWLNSAPPTLTRCCRPPVDATSPPAGLPGTTAVESSIFLAFKPAERGHLVLLLAPPHRRRFFPLRRPFSTRNLDLLTLFFPGARFLLLPGGAAPSRGGRRRPRRRSRVRRCGVRERRVRGNWSGQVVELAPARCARRFSRVEAVRPAADREQTLAYVWLPGRVSVLVRPVRSSTWPSSAARS